MRSLRDYKNPNSLGSRLRRKRFRHIEKIVVDVLESKDRCLVIDIGGTAQYWNLMDQSLLERCNITISNLAEPKGAPSDENIPKIGTFVFHTGDGTDLTDVNDKQFDLAHSNSVIEHVGKVSDMQKLSCEMRRVANHYYVQTPYMWFPIEPHYGFPIVHWLPLQVRVWLMTHMKLGYANKYDSLLDAYAAAEFINLLDASTLRCLFPDGKLEKEKLLLITKSLMIDGRS